MDVYDSDTHRVRNDKGVFNLFNNLTNSIHWVFTVSIAVVLLVIPNTGMPRDKTCDIPVATIEKWNTHLLSAPVVPIPKVDDVVVPSNSTSEVRPTNSPLAVRYVTSDAKPIVIKKWTGGEPMDQIELLKTISAVFQRLPHIKSSAGLKLLVVETMAVESELGRNPVPYKGAYGSAQMQLSTAKYLMKWTKEKHSDVYKSIMSFYDRNLSLKDNLARNVPYQIAMCITYYWHREPNLYAKVDTRLSRGKLWKSEYNTSKGVGTVEKYLQRTSHIEVASLFVKS